jgi:hypothetical protein
MATVVFTAQQARAGTERIDPWVEFQLTSYPAGTTKVYRWGKVDVADVSNYGDAKSDQIISFGRILRTLTGRDGQLQASNASFSVHDDTRKLPASQGLSEDLQDLNLQHWYNRIVRYHINGSSGKTAGDSDRILFRGYLTDYGTDNWPEFNFSADDQLTSQFSPFGSRARFPWRVTSTAQHTNCPAENLGLPEAWWYGEVTDTPDGTDKGAVPTKYVGTETISGDPNWHKFEVCGHAVKQIDDVYAGGVKIVGEYGVTVLAPGKAGWPFAQVYRDIGGRRYTILYAKGPIADAAIAGTAIITCNGQGAETVGDGSGTLIDHPVLQFRHILYAYVINNYLTGLWPGNVPWSAGDPTVNKVNATSFDTVAAQRPTHRGAFLVGVNGQLTFQDIVRLATINGDCQFGHDIDSQMFVVSDEPTSPVADFTDDDDVILRAMPCKPDPSLVFNEIPYLWKSTYTEYQTGRSSGRRTQASIDAYLSTKTDDEVAFEWIRDDATALALANLRAARHRAAPHFTRITLSLYALHLELGQRIRLTHSYFSWALREFRIEQIEIDLDALTVDLVLRDMTASAISATTTTFVYDSRTGSSGSYVVTASPETIAVTIGGPRFAGGSMDVGIQPAAGTYENVRGMIPITIDWNILPSTVNLHFDVLTRTRHSGTSVTPRVRDDANAINYPGTVSTGTAEPTAPQTITITHPGAVGSRTYWLQATRGATTNVPVYILGSARIEP